MLAQTSRVEERVVGPEMKSWAAMIALNTSSAHASRRSRRSAHTRSPIERYTAPTAGIANAKKFSTGNGRVPGARGAASTSSCSPVRLSTR